MYFFVGLGFVKQMLFKRISLVILLLFPLSALAEDSIEQEIESIYSDYIEDFINNDFDGMVSHFQAPTMVRFSDQSTVLETKEIIKDFYRDMKSTIQEGYAYSKVDKIEVKRATNSIYFADVRFSRYNKDDELLVKGHTVYFFNNQGGPWRMFYIENLDQPLK